MGRLFDAGARKKSIEQAKFDRDGVRRRAEAVDKLIAENLQLSEASDALGEQLAASQEQSVHTVVYSSFRAPGSKWNIEHAQVGDDYVYQIFALRPPALEWRDVMTYFISVMDGIFPRSVSIKYAPPSQKFQLSYYTIRVQGVTRLPGWEQAAKDRALRGLSGVEVWAIPETSEES